MAPGPVTATTIVMGSRSRWAGALIAVGHGIVELPLIVLIVIGVSRILKMPVVQILIGLGGAVFLFIMASEILWSALSPEQERTERVKGTPIMAGIVLTAGNPYFLLWWATIGLGYLLIARRTGAAGLAAFLVGHIMADLIWYTIVSSVATGGKRWLTDGIYRGLIRVCAIVLLGFAVYFGYYGVNRA